MTELKRSIEELRRVARLSHALGGGLTMIPASYKMVDALEALVDGHTSQATTDIMCSVILAYKVLRYGIAKTLGQVIDDIPNTGVPDCDYFKACDESKVSILAMVAGSKLEQIVRSIP